MVNRRPFIFVAIITVAYTAWFSWFTITRHHKTNSTRFDLGNVEQTVWATAQGNLLHMTNPYGVESTKRLAFHGDLILLPVALLYALWPQAEMLLLLQTLALASGAIALWLIGRRMLRHDWLAAIAAGMYLLHPAVQWTNIFDWHAVALAPALILWTTWAVLTKHYRLGFLLIMLAAMTKEEIGLMAAAIGIFVWWRQRQKNWGPVLTLAPLLWSMFITLVTIPTWQGMLATPPPVFQSVMGDSAETIIRQSLSHPRQLFAAVIHQPGLSYLWQLGWPFGLMSFGSLWALAATPDIVINLISTKPAQHLLFSHYTAGIIPWLALGTVWTLAAVVRRFTSRPWLTRVIMAWLVASSLGAAYGYGPLPGTRHDHTRFATWRNVYAATVRQWAKTIPTSAAVSVTNNIGSQFAQRYELYSFPLGIERADYVIVLEGHATPVVATADEVAAAIAALRSDPEWQTLHYGGDLTILQRTR